MVEMTANQASCEKTLISYPAGMSISFRHQTLRVWIIGFLFKASFSYLAFDAVIQYRRWIV